jgi:hypothetical protein
MSREELKKILDGFYGSEKEKVVEYIISWARRLRGLYGVSNVYAE